MKVNKVAACLVAGICILSVSATAAFGSINGYANYKTGVKALALDVDNVSGTGKFSMTYDGKEVLTGDAEFAVDGANQSSYVIMNNGQDQSEERSTTYNGETTWYSSGDTTHYYTAEAEKEKKRLEVVALWDSLAKPDFITLDNVWSDRFLNKTATMSGIQNDMETFINRVNMDLATLASIPADDVAMDAYKRTLNVASALEESNRIKRIQEAAEARKRAEAERAAEEAARNAAVTAQQAAEAQEQKTVEETVTEAPKDDSAPILAKWMRFEAFMTVEQAVVLRDFCKANGIALRRPQD